MGASQSSPQQDEKVFTPDTSLHFSEDVVNQLVDHKESPEIAHERQLTIDAHIRARIQSELTRLHREEERVREEIERALEKENLDRERSMAGEDSAAEEAGSAGSVKSSAALMGDLEELRQKVEKYHARQQSEELSAVRTKGEEVVLCYQSNPTTTLNCWKTVEEFKASVARVEQHYVNSLR
ncbi:hypothetical protein BD309DRAFT_946108 [Dichomitus squalens]|uniref:DUF1690-domain-containing protein n=1 Tax=Dichomitus squalens TaxID=114155 RepID=A0A4Q9MPC1_9APHY|nr:uncharacterized protein DICSQDRAFT_154399 [Dichomitus squalens LYAD-421 SS1]EJF62523.1 hypothetical protein DICSQDRAFT_154399 [Dichomitus squalens LYAD-421 SS1]TBU28987.1 hypothetical protein BD311DRAFT_757567 [Dichomitus squalens]TBU50207.1 hypothetical protein BD309DRAFT_946108 [Dichomitus squalens]TBU66228.1 hypothetical protein BD310DRAFT_913007 [Dichomitus squalens]